MNLFTDAFYTCACGRLSLMPTCPRCVPTQRYQRQIRSSAIAPSPVSPASALTLEPTPTQPTDGHWEQVKAVAEEAKTMADYVKAGVFDVYVYCEQIGDETIFFAQSADKPLEGNVTPLYRFKRVMNNHWRTLILTPSREGSHRV